MYENIAWIPLRDRALLRLAAVTIGDLHVMPEPIQESSPAALQVAEKSDAIRSLDRRRLARIERQIEDTIDQQFGIGPYGP